MIGQFYGSYSTVRPSKFESSQSSSDAMFCLSKFLTKKIKRLHSGKRFENKNDANSRLGRPNLKLNFSELLESKNVSDVAYVEHPEHHSSQKLDSLGRIITRRSQILNNKKKFKEFCQE